MPTVSNRLLQLLATPAPLPARWLQVRQLALDKEEQKALHAAQLNSAQQQLHAFTTALAAQMQQQEPPGTSTQHAGGLQRAQQGRQQQLTAAGGRSTGGAQGSNGKRSVAALPLAAAAAAAVAQRMTPYRPATAAGRLQVSAPSAGSTRPHTPWLIVGRAFTAAKEGARDTADAGALLGYKQHLNGASSTQPARPQSAVATVQCGGSCTSCGRSATAAATARLRQQLQHELTSGLQQRAAALLHAHAPPRDSAAASDGSSGGPDNNQALFAQLACSLQEQLDR
jgi:hypothetical protein